MIFERLEDVRPGRALSYSFAGTPPIPVLTSHTTITLTDAPGSAGRSTNISWSGAYDVLGDDDRRTAEHVDLHLVWPASVAALATALNAEHSLDTPVQPSPLEGGNNS